MHRICQRNPNNSEFGFTLMKTKIGPISMSNFHGNILSRETAPLAHCGVKYFLKVNCRVHVFTFSE